eukprot:1161817-Pelagomonas_calceolata.AAC.4
MTSSRGCYVQGRCEDRRDLITSLAAMHTLLHIAAAGRWGQRRPCTDQSLKTAMDWIELPTFLSGGTHSAAHCSSWSLEPEAASQIKASLPRMARKR